MNRAWAVGAALLLAPSGGHAETPPPLYDNHCSVCHQAGGVGAPGAYPRLTGRAGAIAGVPEGRKAMVSAALYGVAGVLKVDGQSVIGVMPGFAQFKDAEIAEVLTYVSHLGGMNPKPFTAAEVAEVRLGDALTPNQVNGLLRQPTVVQVAP